MKNPEFIKQMKEWQSNPKFKELQKLLQPHKFWDTQPVPKFKDMKGDDGPIITDNTLENVQKDPRPLPTGFEWSNVNLLNDEEAEEVYTLLKNNYVEDDDHMFRFEYSIPFLRWVLCSSNYVPNWHFGIRATKDKKLLAFISGIPVRINVRGNCVKMAEINYLCVHSKLRNKRIAPALIAEVTRRVNLKETWQAIYTAGVEIPKPITTARYFHRNLNVKRLIDFKFTGIKPGSTLSANIKLYKLPDSTSIQGVRKMTKKDSKAVHELLTNYLLKFPIHQEFSYEEVVRNLVPKDGVIYSYVVENGEK